MYWVFLQLWLTAGGVASVGARATFSSPDENARAGETAPKSQCQPTLATPLVSSCIYFSLIENVKVVPLPFSELTCIVPPSKSMIFFTVDKPTPVPFSPYLSMFDVVSYRLNMLEISSFFIPIPLSWNVKKMLSLFLKATILIFTISLSLYFKLFEIRFINIY